MKGKDINVDSLDWKSISSISSRETAGIRTDKKNNSAKIICFNVVFGMGVSLLLMLTEVMESKIRNFEWIANAVSFLITFVLVALLQKEIKLNKHYIMISLIYLFGLFFKINTARFQSDDSKSVFAYISLSCCLMVFLASLCFDRRHKFKWLHFLSIIFVFLAFGLYCYFNVVMSSLIEIRRTWQLAYIIVSVVFLSIATVYQQIFFLSGHNIYQYLELQGLCGFVFFISLSWSEGELSYFFSLHFAQFDPIATIPYLLYCFGMVAFSLVYPFYLKKAHCVMSTMFLGWKCLFDRRSSWLIFIGENVLFFLGAIGFNIKKVVMRYTDDALAKETEDIEKNCKPNNLSIMEDTYFRPLMNENFKENLDDSSFENFEQNSAADRRLAFYKQKKMTSVNKYLI